MSGAQNRENIENINKHIKLAPLPPRGGVLKSPLGGLGGKNTRIVEWSLW
jgi:hypothetical protein